MYVCLCVCVCVCVCVGLCVYSLVCARVLVKFQCFFRFQIFQTRIRHIKKVLLSLEVASTAGPSTASPTTYALLTAAKTQGKYLILKLIIKGKFIISVDKGRLAKTTYLAQSNPQIMFRLSFLESRREE